MKKGGDAENPTTKPPLTIIGGDEASEQQVAAEVQKL